MHTGNEFTCLTAGGSTQVLLSQTAAEQGRQVSALWYPDHCGLRQVLAHSEPWQQMKAPGCIFKYRDICILADTDKYRHTRHRSNSEVSSLVTLSPRFFQHEHPSAKLKALALKAFKPQWGCWGLHRTGYLVFALMCKFLFNFHIISCQTPHSLYIFFSSAFSIHTVEKNCHYWILHYLAWVFLQCGHRLMSLPECNSAYLSC